MSDQENSQVKIFFDSNRFPWERQYTDGKGNWYYKDQLNYDENNNMFGLYDPKKPEPPYDPKNPKNYDPKNKILQSFIKILFDSNKFAWEAQYTDSKGNWYYSEQVLYDESNHTFYLADFNDLKLSITTDSDLISSSTKGLDSLDESSGGPIDDHLIINSRGIVSATSALPTLLYCLETRKLYNSTTKKEAFDPIQANGKFYISYHDPKSKEGTYDPKNSNQWKQCSKILSNLKNNHIQSIKYKNGTITYIIKRFENYEKITKYQC